MIIYEMPVRPGYVYLYALMDSRNCDIRYIGSSHNPTSRYQQHLQSKKELAFVDWWLDVVGFGGEVVMYVFWETTKRDRETDEQWAIDVAIAKGYRLFNIKGTYHKATVFDYVIAPLNDKPKPVRIVPEPLPAIHRPTRPAPQLRYSMVTDKMRALGYA